MRHLFYLILCVWVTGSLVCTGLNVNAWPFPSLNVFSDLPREKTGQWVIRVSAKNKIYELDPGHVLPLEFFVARSFVSDVVKSKNDVKLGALLNYVNAHLGESRFGFDERWEKKYVNLTGLTNIQIVLKVSKIERLPNLQIHPLTEFLVGETSYVR